jgi:hypothetical protein
MVGLPILITSQALVVMHLRMQIFPDKDAIRWLELKVGEEDRQGRMKTYNYKRTWPPMDQLKNALKKTRWAYHIGLGERNTTLDAR